MKTLDIDECAEFLKINRTAASEMAVTGDLPGARIGPAWVFLEDDLVEYLRTLIRHQRRERQETLLEKKQDEECKAEDEIKGAPTTILQHRRNQQAMPPVRSRDFATEEFPSLSATTG